MELVFDLFFRRLIINTVGLYSRYVFFRIIGRKKEVNFLSGMNKRSSSGNYSQGFYNSIIGIIMSLILIFLIVILFALITDTPI
jgi:uncharacterized paraquat-inducible protein A